MTTNRFVDRDNIEHTEFESDAYQRDLALALAEKQQPRSCLKCSHFKTCFLYRNEAAMLEGSYHMLDKKDWPCQPEDRAWTCHYFELDKKLENINNNNVETRSHL